MKQLFGAVSFGLVYLLLSTSHLFAANRFNVLTYYDYDDINYYIINRDSFYIQLDEMGISHFLTMSPDSAAKYKDQYDLNMSLITNHWRPGFIIYLDDSNKIPINPRGASRITAQPSAPFLSLSATISSKYIPPE